MIQGYDAEIPKPFWYRITQYGLPTQWFAIWLGLSTMQIFVCVWYLPLWWGYALGVGLAIVGAELCIGRWVTRADPQWDTLLCKGVFRRRIYYEAE